MAIGSFFWGSPIRLDPSEGPSSHFPNPKVVKALKKPTLEEEYLLSSNYKFLILDPDATVNRPTLECIVVYHTTFTYGLSFPSWSNSGLV